MNIEGVLRADTESGAVIKSIGSSGSDSAYGSNPSSMTCDVTDFNANSAAILSPRASVSWNSI